MALLDPPRSPSTAHTRTDTPTHIPGISTYVRQEIPHTIEADTPTKQQIPNAHTIMIHLYNNNKKQSITHTIINIYRRPHHDKHFTTNLQSLIDTIYSKHPKTNLIITGDLNINLLKLTYKHKFFKLMTANDLSTTITQPTRIDTTRHTSTLIDPFLTSIKTHITSDTIYPPLSDHIPTLTIIHTKTPLPQQNRTPTLNKRTFEKQKENIISALKSAITNLPQDNDPHSASNILISTLQNTIDSFKSIPKPNKYNKPTAIHDHNIHKQLKLEKSLYIQSITQQTPQNIIAHKKQKKKVHKLIKQAIQKKINNDLSNNFNNPKKKWQIIKRYLPQKQQQTTSPSYLEYENNTFTNDESIANSLNDHFITIGKKTIQQIPTDKQTPDPTTNNPTLPPLNPLPPQFELSPTTPSEIQHIIAHLDPNTASDIFDIAPAMLKELAPTLAPQLCSLFNDCLLQNIYPDILKTTKAIALPKNKITHLPANFRPISLLPIIGKIFDTLINKQLMLHLTTHNLISPHQYAFRPNSDTTMALTTIIDDITKNVQNKIPTIAIMLDLTKAYDTISHKKLLYKLKNEFNFHPNTLALFSSYFTNRTQSLHTTSAQSTFQTITHGIPQGSTLSTTLFLLYTNTISKTSQHGTIYTYADDTTVILSAPTTEILQQHAQETLNNLTTYLYNNNLIPNPTKTTYTPFYPKIFPKTFSLTINDTNLEQQNHTKLLGLVLQNNLKYDLHIQHIIKKLQPLIHTLRHINKIFHRKTLINIYFSLAYPHLILHIPIWGNNNSKKTYLQPLHIIHKKIIRLICNTPPKILKNNIWTYSHTLPLMKKHNILSIFNLYTLRTCLLVHPYLHWHPPLSLPNRPHNNNNYTFVTEIHNYETRYALNKHLYIPNNTKSIPSSTKQRTQTWNQLPLTIRQNPNLATFKKEISTYLLRLQNTDIDPNPNN